MIEEINRISDARVQSRMFRHLADDAEDSLVGWQAAHCTKVMAGGGFCGWPLAGYDGDTCGHND
jgi:hypothetical protein